MNMLRMTIIGGFLLLLGALVKGFRRAAGPRLHTENMLDAALDDTFPASDPTSTQDFSSPDDRELLRAGLLKG